MHRHVAATGPPRRTGLETLFTMGFPHLPGLCHALAPSIPRNARHRNAGGQLSGAAALLSSNCYKTDTFGSCKLTTSGVEATRSDGPDILKSMETTCPT
jgi:hypothetical protein